MDFEYRAVSVSQIDPNDTTYRITGSKPVDDLVQSIRDVGLLRPPLLKADGQRHVIVSGFKRIAACRRLGWPCITAGLLDTAISAAHCAIIAVADQTAHRKLNLVEQAQAVNLLARVFEKKDALFAAARKAGLEINAHLAEKLNRVVNMSQLLQSGLIEGSIALPVALAIDRMQDKDAADSVTRLLNEFNYSLNQQREVLEAVTAVSRRDGIPIPRLLGNGAIGDIRLNEELDRGHKARMIRDYFKTRRYPTISSVDKQFQKLSKQLKLDDHVQLIAPRNFESPTYALRFEFNKPEDLTTIQKELNRLVSAPEIKRLWDLFHLDEAP